MITIIKSIIVVCTMLSLLNTYLIDYSTKHYLIVVILGVSLFCVFAKYSKISNTLKADMVFVSAIVFVATILGAFIPNKSINQGLYVSFYIFSVMSLGYFWVGLQKFKEKLPANEN